MKIDIGLGIGWDRLELKINFGVFLPHLFTLLLLYFQVRLGGWVLRRAQTEVFISYAYIFIFILYSSSYLCV